MQFSSSKHLRKFWNYLKIKRRTSLPWNILRTWLKWLHIYQDAPWSVKIQHELLHQWGFSSTPTKEEEEMPWYLLDNSFFLHSFQKLFNMFSLFFHPISVGGQARNYDTFHFTNNNWKIFKWLLNFNFGSCYDWYHSRNVFNVEIFQRD